MSIRDRIAGFISPELAQKAAAVTPDGDFGWSGPGVDGGIFGAESAQKVSAVFACVSIIAETVGSIPLEFKRIDGAEGEGFKHVDAFAVSPNPLQTGIDFWSEMAWTAALHGEAVAEPLYNDGFEIWPLPASRLSKRVEERSISYEYQQIGGIKRDLSPVNVFRFSGLSVGLQEIVPWETAKQAIELARVLETQGKNFFQNSARLAGYLYADGSLTEEAYKRLKKQFNSFSGAINAGKTPIFEEGLKYNTISASNQDSQYNEIREAQIREIALYWHIPLYRLGLSAGKTSVEQQDLDFAKYLVRPWLKRIEQAIARDLLSDDERKIWKPKFNMDGLLRADSKTRASNRVLDRTSGTISINEGRAQEGLPKIDEPWADDVREPLNSNRAADTMTGGETAPQDDSE